LNLRLLELSSRLQSPVEPFSVIFFLRDPIFYLFVGDLASILHFFGGVVLKGTKKFEKFLRKSRILLRKVDICESLSRFVSDHRKLRLVLENFGQKGSYFVPVRAPFLAYYLAQSVGNFVLKEVAFAQKRKGFNE
jgi:hypothetical protein